MNPEEEFAILNALDEGSLAANEVDSALRALSGSDADKRKTLELIVARQQSGYNPNQRLSGSPKPRDSDFDYDTGADSALRALMSFGETAAEREGILRDIVGEKGYTRDSQGQLALTEAGQLARGIEPTGKNLVIEDEGFSLGDFADLAGIVPETVGAIVGGILGAPGLVTGAAGAAAGAATGQAIEEGVESLLGVQQQTAGEIAGDVATEAALAGGLDFITVGTFRLGKSIVGGAASKVGARGEPLAPEMGKELVDRGYKPSLEALGAPTLLAKGVKFAKGATGSIDDIVENTEKATAEAKALLAQLGAARLDRAGKAFEDVTSAKFTQLEKQLKKAQQQSLDAVESSLALVGKSLDEGFDINPEALGAITTAFDTFNTSAVRRFEVMDELLAKLDIDATAAGLKIDGGRIKAINLGPESSIKGTINDIVEGGAGTRRLLDPNVDRVIRGLEDLGEAATFGNISAQRKLINDIIFSDGGKDGLSSLGRDQLFKIRTALDNALDADQLIRVKGLAPGQNKQLAKIGRLRKEAINNYREGLKRFDELERFGVLKDVRDATTNPQLYADQFFNKIVKPNSPERLKATLKATDNPDELRQALARSYADNALLKTGIDLNNPSKFSGIRFYNEIEKLGSTGKVLFGSEWPAVRQLAKTIAKISPDDMPAEAVESIMRQNLDRGIVDAMSELSEASRALNEASTLSFIKKYNNGSLTPEEAVTELLKPTNKVADWKKIEAFYGKNSPELATIKTNLIERIVSKVDDSVFTSPNAAAEMRRAIDQYDKDLLETIIGKEAYEKLTKFADEMIYLGDVGKEGSIAQGAVAAQVSNSPINAARRDMRNKAIAKVFSSPAVINYYAGKGVGNASKNVNSVAQAVANAANIVSKGVSVARQGGVRAAREQANQEVQRIEARREAARQRQQLPQVPIPNKSSSLASVTPVTPGAAQFYGIPQQASQPSIRQQAATNPGIAQALGIRGATAGLLGNP
jgi:hypothetical protein